VARGGNPKYSITYCRALKDALMDLLDAVLNNPEKLEDDKYRASLLDDASGKQGLAAFLLKDANKFQVLLAT
jgi:hypothetical protein